MKTRIIIICLLVCVLGSAFGQTWIGNDIILDTSIIVSFQDMPEDMFHLQSCVHDDIYFFTDRKSYQQAERDYAAHIYAISLTDYTSFEFNLPFPSVDHRERIASATWINDFNFSGDTCVIAVNDHILLYRRSSSQQYEYVTSVECSNVKKVYIYQGKLYYLEEDHDFGYRWHVRDLLSGDTALVGVLTYEAPHVVQAIPNQYLFCDEEHLYFLSTRYPILHIYQLDGKWVKDIHFNLPDWHPFDDNYIANTLKIPYGAERIFTTKDQIFSYSYAKVVFPLDNQYLLYYTQYDTTMGKSTYAYALADSNGVSSCRAKRCPQDFVFDSSWFPFNLFHRFEDLDRTSWHGRLIELTAESEVAWNGLSANEYEQAKETWFRKHDPIYKIRIMRLKKELLESIHFFQDYQGDKLSLQQLPPGKYVILMHNELECSACSHHLLQAINEIDTDCVHVGILFHFFPGALQAREINRAVGQYLERTYSPYYLIPELGSRYPRCISQRVSQFPAVMFYETGKAPILFSNDEIYDDDIYTYRFTEAFKEELRKISSK